MAIEGIIIISGFIIICICLLFIKGKGNEISEFEKKEMLKKDIKTIIQSVSMDAKAAPKEVVDSLLNNAEKNEIYGGK